MGANEYDPSGDYEELFTAAENMVADIIETSIRGQLDAEGWESGPCRTPHQARMHAQRRLIGAMTAGPLWSDLLERIDGNPTMLLPVLMSFELITEAALDGVADARNVSVLRVLTELRLGLAERQLGASLRNAGRRG